MRHCKLCFSTEVIGTVYETYHDSRDVIAIIPVCADHLEEAMESREDRPTYFAPNGSEWVIEDDGDVGESVPDERTKAVLDEMALRLLEILNQT